MKRLLIIAFVLFFVKSVLAQPNLVCSDYRIESISLTDSGYIAVWMSNSCSDCSSGIDGCLYAEMKIINRADDTDTIGATNCYCLMSPLNGNQRLYLVPVSITALPDISGLRFYFFCSLPFCEDVSISENALSISQEVSKSQFKIYPNPTNNIFNIEYDNAIKITVIQLADVSGRIVKTFPDNEKLLNISGLPSGVYFLNIQAVEGNVSEKILIQ
jgi:hypothetical protein